ncbi:MAG TPA: hypothetical protein VIK53_11570 [Verrucomicrobiae bacterium]
MFNAIMSGLFVGAALVLLSFADAVNLVMSLKSMSRAEVGFRLAGMQEHDCALKYHAISRHGKPVARRRTAKSGIGLRLWPRGQQYKTTELSP